MQLLRRLSFTMLLMSMMTLVACGDGDGDLTGGDGGGTPGAVTLTVTKSDGDLAAANDVTVTATVLENGSAVANKTVTFSLAVDGSATLDPIGGTATTDTNGVATINVKVTDVKGSVNVIASYESDSDNISFDSVGDGESDDGSSGAAKISLEKSAGDLSAANAITISASILSLDNGEGLEGQLVTFTLNDATMATFDPAIGTAVTDASGIATIIAKVTDVAGGVEVTATATGLGSDTGFTKIGFTSVGDGVKVIVGEPKAETISLFASSQQLASSGAQTIELTAIAKDASNNLLEGVTISFASDSGSIESVVGGTNVTGADGTVVKILSTPAEPSNRVITVTITNDDISDLLEIQVVGTILTLTGSSSLAIDDGTSYIIKVLDSDGNGVANTDVIITLAGISTEIPAGDVATITTASLVKTDFNGQVALTVTGTTGGTNSIVATALGATISQDVSVQSDSFVFTNFSNVSKSINPSISPILPDVALSKMATIELTWKREGVIVPDGTLVEFTTTRGDLIAPSATTFAGKVSVTLTSNNAGKALVSFIGSDNVNGKDIKLSNQLEFEFFADTADSLIAQTSTSTIAPDGQTSTISVIVRDISDNLVKNKTVDFKLADTSGGEIFPASGVTDSNGSASTVYTSNSISQVNGVTIESTVRDTPLVKDSISLTVSQRSAYITLQTGNTILQHNDNTYNKQYSVQVNDLNGAAINNLTLAVSAIPKDYHKGEWVKVLKDGKFDHYAPLFSATCFNEDGSNGGDVDGILDGSEDVNSNTFLTPGNIATVTGEVTTDENGSATIDILYGENYGGWVDIDLIATAKVSGSENIAHVVFRLSSSSADVTVEANPPAAFIWPAGPFGIANDCTNAN